MKRFVHLTVIALTLLALAVVVDAPVSLAGESRRVLVEFKPGRGAAVRNAVKQAGGQIHYEFGDLNTIAVSVPENAVQGLQNNPNVVFIEEDAPRYPMGGPTIPWGIDRVQARDVWDADRDGVVDDGAPTGAGVKVCIIDSGIYADHEDFAGVSLSGTSVSGTGNWYEDTCGHGSHVAGTIAAALNDVGVVGVTPGGVALHIVKVFDGADCGWAYTSDLVAASGICVQNGADIISMSLGGGRKSRKEETAFNNYYGQGVLSIAAAGNDGNTALSYPASYDSVVSVAAIDENDLVADFSQQNAQVEIAAPGVGVLSTVPWIATNSLSVDGVDYEGHQIEYAALGTASGELVDGGLCAGTGSWEGKVVLCERGDISFVDKVMNVQNSGGAAAVVYNNEPGNFYGTLGEGASSNILAISLSQEDGQYLVANKLGAIGDVLSALSQPDSGYEAWEGTSMATPHVSAVAALLWSSDLGLTNAEIREAIVQTALDLGDPGRDVAYGYGLAQAYDAWQYLGGGSGGNVPPTASFGYNCDGLSCTFDGTASGDGDGTIVSYAWDFGDGGTASGATASHTFADDGAYLVTLTVTDDDGASDDEAKTVTVSSGSGGDTMHVEIIDMWYTTGGRNRYVYTRVTIVDSTGMAVSGATVYLTTNSAAGSGVTGADGTVTFSLKTKVAGLYTSTVTDVTHATLTYDPAANGETSETLSVP